MKCSESICAAAKHQTQWALIAAARHSCLGSGNNHKGKRITRSSPAFMISVWEQVLAALGAVGSDSSGLLH